jgi:predicted N-formylglutamate amidohydrolase
MTNHASLLEADEPASFVVTRAEGSSPLLFTCDHAGRRIPRQLGSLGVPDSELARHIAWDIGAAALGYQLSARLDACLITQTYSRLVIDVNRPLESAESIVTLSEQTAIPGNVGLRTGDIQRRQLELFWPYHQCISNELSAREKAGRPTLLVSLHSFTPRYKDVPRPWHIGVLYGRDVRVGKLLLGELRTDCALRVGENEPYAVSDETDFTVVEHGEKRGIPHVELEIRQDLLGDEQGCAAVCERLAPIFERICAQLFPI